MSFAPVRPVSSASLLAPVRPVSGASLLTGGKTDGKGGGKGGGTGGAPNPLLPGWRPQGARSWQVPGLVPASGGAVSLGSLETSASAAVNLRSAVESADVNDLVGSPGGLMPVRPATSASLLSGSSSEAGGLVSVRAVSAASLISAESFAESFLQGSPTLSPTPEDDKTGSAQPEDSEVKPDLGKENEECAASDPYLDVAQGDVVEAAAASGHAAVASGGNTELDKLVDVCSNVRSNKKHIFVTSPPGIGKTTMVQKLLAMLRDDQGRESVDIDGFYTEEMRDAQGQRAGFDVVRVRGKTDRCALARHGAAQPKVGKYTIDVAAFDHWAIPTMRDPLVPELPENPRLLKLPREELLVSLLQEGVEIGAPDLACTIIVQSTGVEETMCEASLLEPVPEGWKPAAAYKKREKARLIVCDEVGKMELLSIKFVPALLAALDSDAVVLGTLPEQQQKAARDHAEVAAVKKRPDVKVARLTRANRDSMVPQVYSWLRESLGLAPTGKDANLPAGKDAKLPVGATAPAIPAGKGTAKPAEASTPIASPAALPLAEGSPAIGSPLPGGSPLPESSPFPAPSPFSMASPSPAGSPGPEDDTKDDKGKKDKKDKKEKKAAKREAERLEGLRRAEERKKRREGFANTPKTPMSMEIDEDVEVEGVSVDLDGSRPAKKARVASAVTGVASAVPASKPPASKAPVPVVEL